MRSSRPGRGDGPAGSLLRKPRGAIARNYTDSRAGATDCFEDLPQDVVYNVLMHLSTEGLSALRLASRSIASRIHPSELPQEYWASRFYPGFQYDMAFYAAASPEDWAMDKTRDWRLLYAILRNILSNDTSPNLKHKRSIWRSLRDVAEPLTCLIKAGRASWCDKQADHEPGNDPESHGMGPVARIHWTRRIEVGGDIPEYQFDVYEWGLLTIPEDVEARFTVSFVRFNGYTYISGLVVEHQTTGGGDGHVQTSGLTATDARESFSLDAEEHVVEVRVYSKVDGVVGLDFILANSEPRSVGIRDLSQPEVGVARLKPIPGNKVCGLGLAFDVCRCISVRIIESQLSLATPAPPRFTSRPPNNVYPLWSPCPPSPSSRRTWAKDQVPKGGITSSFLKCLEFGGPDGSRLSSLNRVSVLMDPSTNHIAGLCFHYNDGSQLGDRSFWKPDCLRTLSDRPCPELSFVIDGKSGERITEFRALSDFVPSDSVLKPIRGLKIVTSFDRKALLQPYGRDMKLPSGTPAILQAPRGNIINGVVAEMSANPGVISRLSILSTRATLDPAPEFAVLRPPSPANAGVEEPSMVRLDNVKRIRFSRGVVGGVRGPRDLSGLWFEFHGSGEDTVLGHWIEECGAIDVAPGESILELKVYFAARDPSRPEMGRLRGFGVSTSLGRSKAVLHAHDGPDKEVRVFTWRTSPYYKTVGLHWSYSSLWDLLLPQHAPSPIYLHFRFQLGGGYYREVQRFFWEETGDLGQAVRIRAITLYLKEDPLNAIGGIQCDYEGGVTKTVGECRGRSLLST
ncbi:unnamed protein product [Parascedosporium putredinis]|uniref:F-box domain-containing protein n=1 Tax=Parascedosporium putredinis TaxID=1442378 RepID=A0A9P1MA01_9PEZI|nr:unnamed protein product [Parascedosporium putredinis]CAI7993068.1 unnamed protein product [Parascedosporium putredinis]